MVIEAFAPSLVSRLLEMIECEYAPFYFGHDGDTDSEMLCNLVNSFIQRYVLDDRAFAKNIPFGVPKYILHELAGLRIQIARTVGIMEDQLPELIHEIYITPIFIGVLIVIKE